MGAAKAETPAFVSSAYANVAAFQINAVPEPETYAMLLAGLFMVGALRRRAARP